MRFWNITFLMLIPCVTLWSWRLAVWLWTFVVHRQWCDKIPYQIAAKSNSYSDLNIENLWEDYLSFSDKLDFSHCVVSAVPYCTTCRIAVKSINPRLSRSDLDIENVWPTPILNFMVGEFWSLRNLCGPITHPYTKFKRVRQSVVEL